MQHRNSCLGHSKKNSIGKKSIAIKDRKKKVLLRLQVSNNEIPQHCCIAIASDGNVFKPVEVTSLKKY